ncbi:hypothetical protein PHMEG_00027546 [Phytophthora megakarya]|uniref:M96 mating-specific protein n=1 Tax=Phytophthora megakarya TaxID=4795 RepID=A0A225V6N7_9STRA|nr:hypothetical protein PHMEG_00027546 [Phytophthora megakarya]
MGLDGDTSVLDEAAMLSLLEGCDMAEDVDAIPSVLIDSPPSPQLVSKPATSTGKLSGRSSWHLQRRDELLTLQDTEKYLIFQLQQLKQKMRMTSRNFGTKRQKSQVQGNLPHILTWEEICERQAVQRQKCEKENRKLRDEVKDKIWQAKTLLKMFKRRLRNEVVSSSIKLCRTYGVDTAGVTMPTNNEAVFHELLLGMDEMYAVVDDFFEKAGMDEVPCPGRKNTTPDSRAEGKFVEFLDCYAVPFSVQDTEKAIWRCLRMEEPQSPKPAFVQVDFYIWEIISISFQETTRIIVQPGTPTDVGPTTVIQSHRQSTTSHDAYALAVRRVPRTFIDMGIAAWENSIARFNHFVEDALIQEKLHV